jgi:hypothetical protein
VEVRGREACLQSALQPPKTALGQDGADMAERAAPVLSRPILSQRLAEDLPAFRTLEIDGQFHAVHPF